jgi:hypothetical protein
MSVAGDLGFHWEQRRGGEVQVFHHGRLATTLRHRAAADFVAEAEDADADSAQQLMARVTGNYKRGNEHQAAQHPRNRR